LIYLLCNAPHVPAIAPALVVDIVGLDKPFATKHLHAEYPRGYIQIFW